MRTVFAIILLLCSLDLYSQLRGNNLAELQIGNVPGSEPSDLITHYNRLNLLYSYKFIRASLRYEHFVHPQQEKEYYKPTQYNLSYRKKGLELEIGHFDETLGNGLLLRSYEIPAAILEDQAYRIKQGFYRDIRGLLASYNHKYFKITLLRGRSLLNTLPPTFDAKDRRIDLSEAVQLEGRLKSQNLGLILMRNHNSGDREDFISVFMKGSLSGNLAYNFEIAREFNDPGLFNINKTSSYALYGNLNYSFRSLGISLEYKDYNNFFLGSGINDPPTLIREHGYRVLNRSTHVPDLSDESGFQLETYYTFQNANLLTLNIARTKNDFFRTFIFQEYFLEFEARFRQFDVMRLFLDYSSDPLRSEDNRYSGGFLYELLLKSFRGISLQGEYQYIERKLTSVSSIHNFVLTGSVYKPSSWSVSLNIESSTDPLQTALLDDPDRKVRYWPGISGSYHINKDNILTLFAGQRRGGPACTSGICYEVLDFEGVEFRLATKF